MKYLLANLPFLLYNITLLAGTAYLVQFYDWSPWWFLLAVVLMISKTETKETK